MKKVFTVCAAALVALGLANNARADLVYDASIFVSGTGLGAVYSVTTAHDPGGPDSNNIEGSCINQNGSFTPCLGEVTEHDNQTGAGNNVWTFDATASSFAAVVNISETGQDQTAVLTGLYLQFCSVTSPASCYLAQYLGPDKTLNSTEGTGLGGSGWVFALTPAEYASVVALPGNLVSIAGGFQFALNTTNDGNETLYIFPIQGSTPVPEPASLTLFGFALTSAGWLARRRRQQA